MKWVYRMACGGWRPLKEHEARAAAKVYRISFRDAVKYLGEIDQQVFGEWLEEGCRSRKDW